LQYHTSSTKLKPVLFGYMEDSTVQDLSLLHSKDFSIDLVTHPHFTECNLLSLETI